MQQNTRTDADIVAKTLSDPECFGVLIDRYTPKLSRYIRRISNASPEETEDLLQDAFIKAYQHLRGFDPQYSFSSWIYRITHNIVISKYRKKKVRPQSQFSDLPEALVASFASESKTDAYVQTEELKEAMQDAINQLPEKYRDVIILYYFEEYSYDEIADILKKPPGTIATWLSRAKKKLETLLASTV